MTVTQITSSGAQVVSKDRAVTVVSSDAGVPILIVKQLPNGTLYFATKEDDSFNALVKAELAQFDLVV